MLATNEALVTSIAPAGPKSFFPMEEATIQFQATSDAATFRMGNHANSLLLAVDNVSLEQIAPAPEPSTWALMLTGVGVTGFALRSRKRATPNFA